MSFASAVSPHSVAASLSSVVGVSGSPVVDMMLATLLSGLLLQHLPRVVQSVSKWLTWLCTRLFSALVSHDSGFKHSVVLTATSVPQGEHEEPRQGPMAPVPLSRRVVAR